MIVLGIDCGPTTSGVALYDTVSRRVVLSDSAAPLPAVLDLLRYDAIDLVAIERVQSYGIAGASLLQTSEVVGRLWQRGLDEKLDVVLLYRREVLRALDVTGKGNRDAMVRERLIEMHPGGKGTKRQPGPLYGVASHAWQALGVAVAAS